MTNNKLTEERIDELAEHVGVFTLERWDDLRDVRAALLELQEYREASASPFGYYSADTPAVLERQGYASISADPLADSNKPLYSAPQKVPEIPESVPDALRDEIIDLCSGYEIGDVGAQEIWSVCRDAMLNSAKS